MNRLAGKTAIMPGGAVSIGRACVIRMAEEGAKVAMLEGEALVADLTAKDHEAAFWAVDLADEAATKAANDAAAARFGGLHVLVNNVGVAGSPKPTDQVTEAEWAVNVRGVFFGTYHASAGAVRLMPQTDAITYAAKKIRVNSIHPADIWAPVLEDHLRATAPDLEAAKAAGATHPIGTVGEHDDIAWAVVWLASDKAKFVTGTEIVIDGGDTAR